MPSGECYVLTILTEFIGNTLREEEGMIKRVLNIGIAVREATATADVYCRFFGFKKVKELSYPEAGVRKSILLWAGNNFFELMEPSEEDSPIRRFLEKRGEGLFQVTMVVDDIAEAVKELEKKGAKVMMWTIDKERDITSAYVNPKSTSGVVFELLTDEMLDKWGIEH